LGQKKEKILLLIDSLKQKLMEEEGKRLKRENATK